MAEQPEHDLFDDLEPLTDRRGVHRAPKRAGAGWIKFAWAALATGVLVVAGVGTLIVTSDSMSLKDFQTLFALPTQSPTPKITPTASPTIDPTIAVNVINATGVSGVATVIGEELAATGWNVTTKTNAATALKETYVYYGDVSLEGAARGLVESLGYGEIKLTKDYAESSAQLTLVIGKNYEGN